MAQVTSTTVYVLVGAFAVWLLLVAINARTTMADSTRRVFTVVILLWAFAWLFGLFQFARLGAR